MKKKKLNPKKFNKRRLSNLKGNLDSLSLEFSDIKKDKNL